MLRRDVGRDNRRRRGDSRECIDERQLDLQRHRNAPGGAVLATAPPEVGSIHRWATDGHCGAHRYAPDCCLGHLLRDQ